MRPTLALLLLALAACSTPSAEVAACREAVTAQLVAPSTASDEAWTVCRTAILSRVPTPSTVVFAEGSDFGVDHDALPAEVGDDLPPPAASLTFVGEFDAQNRMGATLRHHFNCTALRAEAGEWEVREDDFSLFAR